MFNLYLSQIYISFCWYVCRRNSVLSSTFLIEKLQKCKLPLWRKLYRVISASLYILYRSNEP